MAPSPSRHLLVWTTLPIAIILSYLWFRRKREEIQSDPGRQITEKPEKSLEQELKEAETSVVSTSSAEASPQKFSRSLSTPIDIILPPELKSQKSSQLVISDEDLDLEIQKVRSMKTSASDQFLKQRDTSASQSLSPLKIAKNEITTNTAPIVEKEVKPQPSPQKENIKKPQNNIAKKNKITGKMVPKMTKSNEKKIVACIEKKMDALKIVQATPEKVSNGVNASEQEIRRQSTERDSANHSPADVMLASPSLSSISDSHSEGSNDSGKGCSEVATPPLRTPAGEGSVSSEISLPTIYEFVIQQALVGRLIGRQGSFVSHIHEKTHAHILIKNHPDSSKLKLCSIEGSPTEIQQALKLIRDKFPAKRYPDLTLEQVAIPPPISTFSLEPEFLCIKLIEGINNDTIVSCMVAPNHLFLQQPTHPTFPNLSFLSSFMNACYTDTNSPALPNPIPANTVCAAYSLGAWYRAIVLSTDIESDTSDLKFLDYGGYANTANSELRQIRADFLTLPFQASECYLSNIRPVGGDDAPWSEEAFTLVADLTKGSVVYTQVADYTEDGIPLVLIYVAVGPQQIVFLNGELVNRGYAEWISPPESETTCAEGAVGGIAVASA